MQEQESPRKRGCLGTLVKIVGIIILILIVSGIVGTVYENQAEKKFLEDNPPPGDLIDVGGRNLHINCTGDDSPTIILDAGQGGWSIDYVNIQAELAETNRVCSYDRAGYGWSDSVDDERTLENIATDLHTLLENAEIEAPYVLVAFSFTGLTTRYYYGEYADELAGIVLLDPAVEGDADLQSEEITNAQRSLLSLYSGFEALANMGVVRLLNPAEMAPYAPFIPENPVSPDLYYAGLSNPDWWATSRKEFNTNLFVELPELPEDFDIPVRIIGLSNSIPDENFADMNQAHLNLLRELADSSNSAELIVFDDIAHDEIIKETGLVFDVIRGLPLDS